MRTYQETIVRIAEAYHSGSFTGLGEIEATLYLMGLDHEKSPEELMSDVKKYIEMTLPDNVYSFFGK